MNLNETQRSETGLQFFGKLSAAVSHDLKNVLSIINEKTGLLEDFCQMAQRGMAIDLERIGTVAVQVKGQVERADRIIRSFNRFAHHTDHPIASVDLDESAQTLVHVAQRLLAQLGVCVQVRHAKTPAVITTRPLMVQELLWAGLQWAAAHRDDRKEIAIAAERRDDGACVWIGPVAAAAPGDGDINLGPATAEICEALQAVVSVDPASSMLAILLADLQAPP